MNKVEVIAIIVITLFTALLMWIQITVWNECRVNNSILYCMRVVGK